LSCLSLFSPTFSKTIPRSLKSSNERCRGGTKNYSYSLVYTRCITLKQQYVFYYNSNSPAMIPTYGKILSIIEKVLWNLVEEYQGIGKSLQDLVEG